MARTETRRAPREASQKKNQPGAISSRDGDGQNPEKTTAQKTSPRHPIHPAAAGGGLRADGDGGVPPFQPSSRSPATSAAAKIWKINNGHTAVVSVIELAGIAGCQLDPDGPREDLMRRTD